MMWLLLAGVWGYSEATLFFIVPDVLLTAMVIRVGYSASLKACLVCSVSAALGGLTMYWFGSGDFDSARTMLEKVPAISSDFFNKVEKDATRDWYYAVFVGGISGVPYKIFATIAGQQALHFWPFFWWSVMTRSIRFFLSATISACLLRILKAAPNASIRPMFVWGLMWFLIYLVYFWIHGW